VSAEITPDRLRSLFRPRSIALVGASNKSSFSQGAFENLQRFGAADRAFLVNRRGVETHGQESFTSCAAIGEPVDLAYMMVPQSGTVEALREAHAAGVRNAVVLSAGYGEAGPTGREAEAELVAVAEELDMLLLGPNMLGFTNFVDRFPVTSVPVAPTVEPGSVALLSQSGASSAAMVDFARLVDVDLSYMVTLGNEAMVTAGHALEFLVADEHTRAIAIFMETIREPEVFLRAARRAAEAGKAVVVLKAGASELSARTAAAHTGALVGDDAVVDAVFRDLGVIRVDTIEDMLQTAGVAAALGPLASSGIGIASISGGACDIIADRASDQGAELPTLAPETTARMKEFFAEYGTVQNPLDVTGAAVIDPSIFTKAITTLADDPAIGVVGVVTTVPWQGDFDSYPGRPLLRGIGAGMRAASVPTVLVNQVVQPTSDLTRAFMADAGITHTVAGLGSAVTALHKVAQWSQRRREIAHDVVEPALPPVPPAAQRRGTWSEAQARELLSTAGIPVVPAVLATSAEKAATAARELGAPVALKVVSAQILHKSDIGGVRLSVQGDDPVREAFDAVTAAGRSVPGATVEGVLVSPMRGPGVELLIGVVRDPSFGPVLAIALGGVLVEVLQDSVLTPLPVSPRRATALLERLKASALLDGYRGGPAADRDALGEVIARIGDLALALGEDLVSLEVNPLRAEGTQVEALDAVVEWARGTDRHAVVPS